MGGRGGPTDRVKVSKFGSRNNQTLREKVTGKTKKLWQGNPNDILKIQHLQNLALWSAEEGSISSLGMFFGHRLLTFCDSVEFLLPPSLLSCKRCESISQSNQISENKTNTRNHNGNPNTPSNSTVHCCKACSYGKMWRTDVKCAYSGRKMWGNKVKREATGKTLLQIKSADSDAEVMLNRAPISVAPETFIIGEIMPCIDNMSDIASSVKFTEMPALVTTKSPEKVEVIPLLEIKKRKKNKSKLKNATEPECGSPVVSTVSATTASSKRKRKSWSSLKDMEESVKGDKIQKFCNVSIPFII